MCKACGKFTPGQLAFADQAYSSGVEFNTKIAEKIKEVKETWSGWTNVDLAMFVTEDLERVLSYKQLSMLLAISLVESLDKNGS